MSPLPRHLQALNPTERLEHAVGSLKIVVADTLGMLADDLGLTRGEVAKRLGKSEAWVSRALSGSQNLTLKSIAGIAHVLGAQVEFRLKPGQREGTPAQNDGPLPSWVADSSHGHTSARLVFGRWDPDSLVPAGHPTPERMGL